MTLRGSRLLPVLLLSLFACDDPSGPDGTVSLAVIAPPDPHLALSVDGDDIVVSFDTWGSSCESRHRDEVSVSEAQQTVGIRPYNRRPDGPCPDDYVDIPHLVRVDTDATGDWIVRVTGRGFTMPPGDDELTVEETIVVTGDGISIPIDRPTD